MSEIHPDVLCYLGFLQNKIVYRIENTFITKIELKKTKQYKYIYKRVTTKII